MSAGNVWALILAAGEGKRLHSLTTTTSGQSVPKQFCSLQGGASLLQEAIRRAEAVTTRERIVSVVGAHHQDWWEVPLASLPAGNVIVQPDNRGTAAGLLLPLLHIIQRDPSATVVVLPSDHFVQDEAILAMSLRQVTRLAAADRGHLYLLGLRPDEVDGELGYIVPDSRLRSAAAPVQRFVEKPPLDLARDLVSAGALLNMFIIAGSAQTFLDLYATRQSDWLAPMREAVAQDAGRPLRATAAQRLYPRLPICDFSRDVLEGQEPLLRALTVPSCGWSDLGTPRRVADTLIRIAGRPRLADETRGHSCLNLAEQHSRLQAIQFLHDCA